MINRNEYIKVDYIDFLTVCDEHNKCYDVEDFRGASHVDGLAYLEIMLEDSETVKVVMSITDYELMEEDILK
jgi:hypothetical protein